MDDQLRDLVCECIERMERDGPRALEELCRARPELADELRLRIEALRASGLVDAAPPQLETPQRLGEFRLLRRLAGGGMGIVYVAEQTSVGRLVALKVLRPELAHLPGSRARFRREIEAVARLSDPGIVAIHAVGVEGDTPYFAMELVEGASLADALEDLRGRDPAALRGSDLWQCVVARSAGLARGSGSAGRLFEATWTEACCLLVARAAESVQHAHERGVLHRDLKPSNLLVTPTGRLVVVDFGLATLSDAGRLTRSGAHLGSLPYMAPEQLRGEPDRIGPWTDVYGLGVALYELLALELPYPLGTASEIERSASSGRPKPLRRANRAVSRDLETVVLTALDPEPARRYAQPGALAQDLERLLAARPVAARRITVAGRALRWSRRHPLSASLAALLAVALAALPINWRALRSEARAERERAAHETQSAVDVARANLRLALEAAQLAAPRAGPEELERLAQGLTATLSAFPSGELGEGLGADRVQLELALGDLLANAGRRGESERPYRALVETCRRLVASEPASARWKLELAAALERLSGELITQARDREGLEPCQEALTLLEGLETPPELEPRARWVALVLRANQAKALSEVGTAEQARSALERARDDTRALLSEDPQDEGVRVQMAKVLLIEGGSYKRLGWGEERAIELLREAWDVVEGLDSEEGLEMQAWVGVSLAGMLGDAQELQEADFLLAETQVRLADLARRRPGRPDMEMLAGIAEDRRGAIAQQGGDLALACEHFANSLERFERLLERHPGHPSYRRARFVAASNLAQALGKLQRGEELIALDERAAGWPLAIEPGPGLYAEEVTAAQFVRVAAAGAHIELGSIEQGVRILEALEAVELSAQNQLYVGIAWLRAAADEPDLAGSDGRSWREHARDALGRANEQGLIFPESRDFPEWTVVEDDPAFAELRQALSR